MYTYSEFVLGLSSIASKLAKSGLKKTKKAKNVLAAAKAYKGAKTAGRLKEVEKLTKQAGKKSKLADKLTKLDKKIKGSFLGRDVKSFLPKKKQKEINLLGNIGDMRKRQAQASGRMAAKKRLEQSKKKLAKGFADMDIKTKRMNAPKPPTPKATPKKPLPIERPANPKQKAARKAAIETRKKLGM